jgi:hypothetical protein
MKDEGSGLMAGSEIHPSAFRLHPFFLFILPPSSFILFSSPLPPSACHPCRAER